MEFFSNSIHYYSIKLIFSCKGAVLILYFNSQRQLNQGSGTLDEDNIRILESVVKKNDLV